jgi:hypothetical protein
MSPAERIIWGAWGLVSCSQGAEAERTPSKIASVKPSQAVARFAEKELRRALRYRHVGHGRRQLLWFAVTRQATAEWLGATDRGSIPVGHRADLFGACSSHDGGGSHIIERIQVIERIQRQNPPQMLLTKDQNVIQVIAPERPNQARDLGEIGRSRIPIARIRLVNACP